MGTPSFAVPSLRALSAGPYQITVVTQPDRPAGRGSKLTPPPVKVAAEELGMTVMQPPSLKDPSLRDALTSIAPEVTVLVAYGEYVPSSLLELPRCSSVNLHPSLLPRWRGSTPIQSAVLAGDSVTGVSVIKMDKGLDTGPILGQRETAIAAGETASELSVRLAMLGAELLAETLPLWLRGEIEPRPQPEQGVTLTRTLKKEDGLIDWHRPAEEIARQVRAFDPWPSTFTFWEGRLFKIRRARPLDHQSSGTSPGTVSLTSDRALAVQTGEGLLQLLEVQLEGKSPVEARALLTGYPRIVGGVLGNPLTAVAEKQYST
ncbi:MAG TPA: methionyl-tRNA formyltransferase [Chloroflexia bacterium]|nr:methionyl-tRNA formyltransferase [Chloroflexia bacterium]